MKRLFQCALSLAFVAVLATGCDDPTSTQLDIDAQFARGGNGVVAMATGSGVRTGSIRHFQFSAIEKANGSVSGQFNLTFEGPGNTHIRGEIVCIRVDGSRAWIGNKITSSGNPVLVGNQGGFDVEDNGEGQGSTDRLSRTFVDGAPDGGLAQDVCDGATFIEFDAVDIDKGNIQVH